MSLEAKIEALTAAVINLTGVIQRIESNGGVAPAPVLTAAPAAVAAPAVPMPAAPSMPAMPFSMPAPAPVVSAPFADATGLNAYTMAAYQQISAIDKAKAMKIGEIIKELGAATLTDIKPEQYGEFHAKVEALKA